MTIQKIVLKHNVVALLKSTLSKDKTRGVLHYLHVGNGVIESTDGRMLVKYSIPADFCPDGAYKIIAEDKLSKYAGTELTLEKVDIEFPNTTSIIPPQVYESIHITLDNPLSFTSAIIGVQEHTGNAVNYQFLERLAKGSAYWNVYANGEGKPVTFKDGALYALIMPYEYKKAELIVEEQTVVA